VWIVGERVGIEYSGSGHLSRSGGWRKADSDLIHRGLSEFASMRRRRWR